MTTDDSILARFNSAGGRGAFYLPDLTLWYQWHHSRGTLPADWDGYSLVEVAHALGSPAWTVARPWRMELQGVEMVTTEAEGRRVVAWQTPSGTLTAAWSLGPDGDWWQTEYPVKTLDDLLAAREMVAARTYVLDTPQSAAVSPGDVAALELPMRPYSDLLHTMLGWGEGLMLLRGDGRPIILEMLALLEEKLRELVERIAALPEVFILAPDNLDSQYLSPRIFREHLASSYAHTASLLHAHGKRLIVHAGGPVKRLLPLLAEAGVDAVEGVAGPPQGDASLAEARNAAGPNLTLWGGIPQDYLLDTYSREDFAAAVDDVLGQVAGDARMILGVADRVPVNADLGRLRQIQEWVDRRSR